MAINANGELTIVEVKSSIEDWRVDQKWSDYLAWCDQLFFAVPIDFPQELIVSRGRPDRGRRLRWRNPAPTDTTSVAAARRKALLIDCARLASERLARLNDPDFADFT